MIAKFRPTMEVMPQITMLVKPKEKHDPLSGSNLRATESSTYK